MLDEDQESRLHHTDKTCRGHARLVDAMDAKVTHARTKLAKERTQENLRNVHAQRKSEDPFIRTTL